jgi:hypothetical protein
MRNNHFPDVHETWNENDARVVFAELRASGESLAAFARRRGVDVQRLDWWKRRFASHAATKAGSALSLIPATVIETAAPITIRLPSGISIEATNASPVWLASIVAELTRSLP